MSIEGFKLTTNSWFTLTKNLYLLISPKIIYTTAPNLSPYNNPPLEIPLAYMPAMGLKFLSTNDEARWLSIGLDMKLVMKFDMKSKKDIKVF